MKRHLVPLLPIEDGESAVSWACRLALFHTGQPLMKFLHDLDVPLPELLAGKAGALNNLANATGASLSELQGRQPQQLANRRYKFRNEEFSPSFMVGTRVAFCPLCLAENDTTRRGLRVGKWSWLFRSVRTCPNHNIALTFLSKEKWSDQIRDLNKIGPRGGDLKKHLQKATAREVSSLQTYILQRFEEGADRHAWLSSQSLEQATRACEMIGVLARWGAKPNLHELSDEDWDLAGHTGFQIAQHGEDEVYEFFQGVLRDFPDRTARNGPQAVFGRLYQWLQFGKTERNPGPIRGLLRKFIVQEMAVGAGTEIFGQVVQKRLRHSSQSLAVQSNLHPKTMHRALVAAGLIDRGTTDRIAGLETCDAVAGEALVEKILRGVPVRALPKTMNATRGQVIMLMENGFLKTIFPAGSVSSRPLISVDRHDVEDFLHRLEEQAVTVSAPSAGFVTIPRAAEASRRLSADIVRLLVDQRLKAVEQIAGTKGYLSILVDPDEIKRCLPVEEVILAPSKTEVAPILGVTPYALDAMMDDEVAPPLIRGIKDTGRGRATTRIDQSEILRFKREYVTLGELKQLSGRHHTFVQNQLDQAGVSPVRDPKKLKVFLYRRPEAELVFS
ncbi:TniQ family protein [Phaeobacter inhibens]|uniref:TniQ family protein n=1 Tax=Phaeobacter inhibens TaxID=221822 RepID=UPI0021A49CA4|nr:TniQ family protein [Phaeobacter inhibens]UWR49780.1 TniQ family protein [Phaeobacter inhibens]